MWWHFLGSEFNIVQDNIKKTIINTSCLINHESLVLMGLYHLYNITTPKGIAPENSTIFKIN